MPKYSLEEIGKFLQQVEQREQDADIEGISTSLSEEKAAVVRDCNEELAKELWCLEQTLKVQIQYHEAFQQLKNELYYEAWCTLEQAEIALNFLKRHFKQKFREYRLDHIREYIAKWQSIFPYKIFMSTELIEGEKECNICGKTVSIRKPCGHRVGEIYNGECCIRIVKDMEFAGMAFVEKPLNKYSVPFLKDPKTGKTVDQYNYAVVKYAIKTLPNAFEEWEYERQKRRHPHSKFKSVGRNDACPCDSGKKYKKCCLNEEGVLMPHIEFNFPNLQPEDLQPTGYSY